MLMKQISLAALTTTIIAGSAGLAHADIHGEGGGAGGSTTSGSMVEDWRAKHPAAASEGTNAYGYVAPSHQHVRTTPRKMKHRR